MLIVIYLLGKFAHQMIYIAAVTY